MNKICHVRQFCKVILYHWNSLVFHPTLIDSCVQPDVRELLHFVTVSSETCQFPEVPELQLSAIIII